MILDRNRTVTGRIGKGQTVTDEIKTQYFSSWTHLAINLAVMIVDIQTEKNICLLLGLPHNVVKSSVEFLLKNQLIQKDATGLTCESLDLFVSKKSPQITNHHVNWRTKALESIQLKSEDALHYSSAFNVVGQGKVRSSQTLKWFNLFSNTNSIK